MEYLSNQEWITIKTCKCGGPVFKYSDSSKNIKVAKCGYTTKEYDIKKKEMVKSKRQPCSFLKTTAPVNNINIISNISKKVVDDQITNKQITKKPNDVDKLSESLHLLFKYLLLTNKCSTLMTINSIVKSKLLRKINDNYLNEYTKESYTEYYTRIFSRPLVVRTPIIIPRINKQDKINYLINNPLVVIKSHKTINDNYTTDQLDELDDSGSDSDESKSDEEAGSECDSKLENDFLEIVSEVDVEEEYDYESD
jgi:hypothetical protein